MKRFILILLLAVLAFGSLSASIPITGDLYVHGIVYVHVGGGTFIPGFVTGGVQFVFLNSNFVTIGTTISDVNAFGNYGIGTGDIFFTGNNNISDVAHILVICNGDVKHVISNIQGNYGPFNRDIYISIPIPIGPDPGKGAGGV